MSEFFRFEDEGRDFPYYKHNPKISKTAWIVLLLTVPIAYLTYAITGMENEILGSFLFCLIMLVPLLYFSKWDYSLIFRKPTRREIKLAALLFIGYLIYALTIGVFLDMIGQGSTSTADSIGVNIYMMIGLIFSMMGEELMKFIPLMFLMRAAYKFTENRKLAVIASSVIIMVYFGLLHYDVGTTLLSVLLTQGLGTIFELYGYIKTKNLFVPYLCHLFTDAFIFLFVLLGF
ncbi:MAG: hypothetical protein IKH85_07095 [Methanobrevibacter sp.]|uniref:CPBP family glutamic-type intramembrane protease n=1 Tax=Methanobrevibacter sp. TaxID=66852 RepID=UPI0025D9834F|nr:CPBP family glutamic-type intramembrane protease [Methanobrevibacter sp.]MBR6993823.1 hypothetical protein [Methanobrevibacter sp.]